VEFDHSRIYTGMVPGMGRNRIPLEFRSNFICLFVTHSLFICTNKCLFGNQTQPLSSSHHQPFSSPPPPFVTATHICRPCPRLPQQDSAMSPSDAHAHDYHIKTAPRHQVNECQPPRCDERVGVSRCHIAESDMEMNDEQQ
jgi:hypothetical protein